jgi:hypothetical protein
VPPRAPPRVPARWRWAAAAGMEAMVAGTVYWPGMAATAAATAATVRWHCRVAVAAADGGMAATDAVRWRWAAVAQAGRAAMAAGTVY